MKRGSKLVWLCLLFASFSWGHNRSESFSEWQWDGQRLSMSFTVLAREVTRLPESNQKSLPSLLESYLQQRVEVVFGGEVCESLRPLSALSSRGGYVRVEGEYACTGTPEISVNAFYELIPTHTHYAKARLQSDSDGWEMREWVLTRNHYDQSFDQDEAQALSHWQAFWEYLVIGGEHILGGIDHLAFVLALVLVASGWRQIIWLVTGFTVGHSISLVLAVLGIAQPNSVMVEALIGYSIALVAIEAGAERINGLRSMSLWLPILCLPLVVIPDFISPELIPGVIGIALFSLCYFLLLDQRAAESGDRAPLRAVISVLFGVVHGFGFAGGLLETGFPSDKLALVLFGFNLGVELGQLLVLLLLFALMAAGKRLLPARAIHLPSHAAMSLLSGLGIFWFISRLVG